MSGANASAIARSHQLMSGANASAIARSHQLMKIAIALLTIALPLMAAEHRDVGLTQMGTRIEAFVVPGPSAGSPTVLLIGGLAGNDETSRVVAREMQTFEA